MNKHMNPAISHSPSTNPSTSTTSGQHVIESLHLTGGYLRGAKFDFSPRLNCLIGGRGSGKTTTLDLLLFGLGVPAPRSRCESFDALVKVNLGNGRATARVRNRHGVRYESSRAYGEAPRVATSAGELTGVSLDGDLFKVDYYTPNQIERIALDPRAQLLLIDKFAETDVRRIDAAIVESVRHLSQNATEVKRLEREIQDDEEKTRELPAVQEGLQALQQVSGPDAVETKKAHEHRALRTREGAALTAVTQQLVAVRAEHDAFVASARRRLSTAIDADLERGPNREVFAALSRELLKVDGAIEDAASRVRAQAATAEKAATDHGRTIAALHAKQDEAYQVVVERQNEDRGRVVERDRLQKRFVELSAVAKRLADTQRECAQRREERRGLVADLRRLCDERFTLRDGVTKELTAALGGEIRVSITRAGNFEAYEELLTELLRGANIRPASFVKEIARSIKPHDLCSLVLHADVAPIVAIDDTKTGKIERAHKILDAIRNSGRMYDLETIAVDDTPLIELKVAGTFRPSTQVSTGQSCTCILPILLLRSESPLIIDEPENHLDNSFIYDVLVKSIAIAKSTRQLIFITHNPNIPVLGDAERVFVLEVEGDRGVLLQSGTVDEVRDAIERILEGGREAFLRRSARYGHKHER